MISRRFRRYLEERLNEELSRSKRYGYPMSFMMIDIDDFKHYNDRNGHQAGDHALVLTAHCLKSSLRLRVVRQHVIRAPRAPVPPSPMAGRRSSRR